VRVVCASSLKGCYLAEAAGSRRTGKRGVRCSVLGVGGGEAVFGVGCLVLGVGEVRIAECRSGNAGLGRRARGVGCWVPGVGRPEGCGVRALRKEKSGVRCSVLGVWGARETGETDSDCSSRSLGLLIGVHRCESVHGGRESFKLQAASSKREEERRFSPRRHRAHGELREML